MTASALRRMGAARPFGLRGLADRVQQLGGMFNIGNHDGRGVRLTADIPGRTAILGGSRDPRAVGRRSCRGAHGFRPAAAIHGGRVGRRRG